MPSVLQELIVVFGGNAALLVVLGFLFKSLLSQMLLKDAERFKAQLKADANMSVERLKNTLQMAALEHQVRFANLHEKRAEVLADLYGQLVETYFEVQHYVYQLGLRGNDQLYEAVEKKIIAFSNFFETHRIYLPEEVCALLQNFVGELRKPVVGIWTYAGGEHPPETLSERREAINEAFKACSDSLLQARCLIEAEFRHILEGALPS